MSVQKSKFNMKLVLFVLATVLALQARCARAFGVDEDTMAKIYKECVVLSGVDKGTLEKYTKVLKSDYQDRVMAESDTMKRYLVCWYKKLGFIDANGVVQKDELARHLRKDFDQAKVDRIVKACAVQKDAAWKTANEMQKCIKKEHEGTKAIIEF